MPSRTGPERLVCSRYLPDPKPATTRMPHWAELRWRIPKALLDDSQRDRAKFPLGDGSVMNWA